MYKHAHDLYQLASHAGKHALTRDAKFSAMGRFLRWQTARFIEAPIIIPFISDTRLIISRNVAGSAGDYYFGAIEFEEMALALHYLQPNNVFGDVGANIGSWTVAAAGVCGANVITLEPLPATYAVLIDNISINKIDHLVRPLSIGAGAKSEKLHLSAGCGVENHIVYDKSGIEIDILPLDDIFTEVPQILKIDVEGFEASVILGSERIINDPILEVIIIEDVGLSEMHGLDQCLVYKILTQAGFDVYSYDPMSRMLTKSLRKAKGNSVYLRNAESVQQKLKNGRTFRVLDKTF